MRLFMVPGMGHCGGGEGPNTFDMMAPLEQWVENGTTAVARRRLAQPERESRSHSAAVRVSGGGAPYGDRKYGRRRELRLPVALDTRENRMSQPARSRATGIALCLVVLASVPASIVHSQEQPSASTSPGRIVTDVATSP